MTLEPLPRPLRAAFWSLHSRTWDGGVSPAAAAGRAEILVAWVRAHAPPGARVIDVGCATGTHAIALADAGYVVTGADFSSGMLARARAKAAARGHSREAGAIELVRWDPERDPPLAPGGYAAALCAGVLQCAADPLAFLRGVVEALAPGGVALIEVKDAAALSPPERGHSVASRAFAPLKRWASGSRAVHRITRDRLLRDVAAAGLVPIDERSGEGWLRVAARAAG